MPVNAEEITWQLCTRHWHYRRQICVPRCTYPGWESDLLVMRPSAWMEEVEIKVSIADFRREFANKSEKHLALRRGRPKRFYWGADAPNVRSKAELEPILSVDGNITGWADWSKPTQHLIHRYWFAAPEELANKIISDIPEYAGLISVGSKRPKIAKPAPVLKAGRKLDTKEQLAVMRLGYIRFWGRKEEVMRSLTQDAAEGLDAEDANLISDRSTE